MSRLSTFALHSLSWLVLAAGLAFTSVVALNLKQHQDENTRQAFSALAGHITLELQKRIESVAVVTRSSAALFHASTRVTPADWQQFTSRLQSGKSLDGINTLGFARFIQDKDPDITNVSITPAGRRNHYGYVLYQSQLDNLQQFRAGQDLLTKVPLRLAMERAADTGKTILSSPFGNNAAIMLTDAVFNKASSPAAGLYGWAFATINISSLISNIMDSLTAEDTRWLRLQLYDGNSASPASLIYQQGEVSAPEALLQQQRVIDLHGHQWLLVLEQQGPVAAGNYLAAIITLAAGLTLTLLLVLLLRSSLNSRLQATELAEQLSKDIRHREVRFSKLENRLNTIASRVPGMIFEFSLHNGHTRFPYASDGIRELFGVHPEQAEKNAGPVFDAIHPDDVEKMASSMHASASTLTPWRHEFRIKNKDGRIRWLQGDALPQREANGGTSWCGVITDISYRKEAELALKAANNQSRHFREALDHVSSFIYMKDSRFRYIYANRAALEQFGCNNNTLLGGQDDQFFSAEMAQLLRESDNRVLAGESISEEVEVTGKDGRHIVYMDVKTPIYDDINQKEIIGLIGIRTDITLLKNSEQQLRQLAHFDPLTKLHNRVLLSDRLSQAMSQARRHQQCLAIAYLDLDGFKAINDTHGHEAGDYLLMTVAARMKDVIREGDTLARVGGDEFVAILLDLKDSHHCKPQLNRLLQAAATPVNMNGLELNVTASLGVTFYPQPEELEPEQLLRQADQAMYQAKLSGKNRYYLFDTEQDRDMRTHHENLDHVRHALHHSEFVLYYQPKVNMRNGTVVGVEALIRWQHPARGLLSPAHFLPAIEEHPLAIELGNWVIDAALQQIREWINQGLTLPVSVNISARQLRQSHFVEQLQNLLGHYPDINPALLELEILETSALGDLAQISERLHQCRRLGIGISLDDFGTGYSSLTYLKQLPAGMVKIDQSFVRDILEDPEDLTILDGVISLARAFNRDVIAEGVETIQHGDMLLRIGCDLAQGYGIARPMPAAGLAAWVNSWQSPSHWANLPGTDRNRLPLLYASIEHTAWIENIRIALHQPGTPWPTLSAEQCRFAAWYRQCSAAEQQPLSYLEELHQQVHELAGRLHATHQAGHTQQASEQLQQLCQLCQQLNTELERALTPASHTRHPAGTRPRLRTV